MVTTPQQIRAFMAKKTSEVEKKIDEYISSNMPQIKYGCLTFDIGFDSTLSPEVINELTERYISSGWMDMEWKYLGDWVYSIRLILDKSTPRVGIEPTSVYYDPEGH